MRISLSGALVVSALLAGCGGTDDDGTAQDGRKAFLKDDIGITFEYPADLREPSELTTDQQVGGSVKVRYAVAVDNDDLIVIERVDLNRAFDESDMDLIQPEIDGLIEQLDPNAGPGRRVTVGGLPGFEFDAELRSGENSRYTILIDGDRQYTVNCQYVDRQAEVEEACEVVLGSVRQR